jgi:hypothetical protein
LTICLSLAVERAASRPAGWLEQSKYVSSYQPSKVYVSDCMTH